MTCCAVRHRAALFSDAVRVVCAMCCAVPCFAELSCICCSVRVSCEPWQSLLWGMLWHAVLYHVHNVLLLCSCSTVLKCSRLQTRKNYVNRLLLGMGVIARVVSAMLGLTAAVWCGTTSPRLLLQQHKHGMQAETQVSTTVLNCQARRASSLVPHPVIWVIFSLKR